MTEHLDPNYGRERRSRRHSNRQPSGFWAFMGFALGALFVLVTVFGLRQPNTIVVNGGGNCCCCQSSPCKPLREAQPQTRGDRIGDRAPVRPALPLPAPEVDSTPRFGSNVPEPRGGAWLPPWTVPGSGGGTRGRNSGHGTDPTPIPEPDSLVLIALGVAAWRAVA